MKIESIRKVIAVAAALTALFGASSAAGITLEGTFNGTTRYVSKSGSDSNGGTGWEDAKLTIQAAVSLCADGDTVIVDDGEYSDTTSWSATDSDTTYTIPTVVQISKRIHLVSRNGKFKTHIVGQWANTPTGVANDGTAHRCIFIGANVGNVLIEGFTIRDGSVAAATAGNKSYDCGAGVYGNNSSGQTYLVDCDVVDCRAGTGAAAARGVIPIRCAFIGNRSSSGGQVFYRTDCAYDCVFANNGPITRGSGNSIFAQVQGTRVVNCTFIDNTCNGFAANDTDAARTHRIWNCAFLGANEFGGVAGGNMYFTNCVQTATGGRIEEQGSTAGDTVGVSEYQHFYAADSGEWKFVVNGDLKDKGFNARSIAAKFVPEEYLDTDFFGNPRDWTTVDIGAIEAQGAAADPASGYIRLDTDVALSTGAGIAYLPRGLVAVADGMAQARIVPALGPATPFFGFSLSGDWGSFYRYPDRGDDCGAWMTPPASGETVTVTAKAATDEKWVDASYAGGDSDGSEAKPYTTIQDAVDNTATYGLVHVAEGTYATGGVTLSGHSVASRVGIENQVAIRASGDPAATIIQGGENTRCVAVRRQAVTAHIQGFTLTGGITDADGTDAGGHGGGFYATPQAWADATGLAIDNQRNAQVADCIFTGNSARQGSAMCGGWAQRCVFSGNVATGNNRGSTQDTQRGAVAFKSVLSACIVRDNLQTRTDTVSSLYKCHPYNVSFAVTNRIDGTSTSYRPVDRNTPAYNCAFLGGYLDDHNSSVTIVPVGNVGDAKLPDKTWFAHYDRDELFVDPDRGDLHLRSATDASTKGDATAYRAAMFVVGDFEGGALAYVDGNPVPGAYSTVIDGRDIYVDALNGSDASDGFSAAAAKKTLAAALAIAYAGDTVHAAPGDYNQGSATYAGGTILAAPQGGTHSPSRGVVQEGVTLVSDEGPDVTFITGAIDNLNGNGLGDTAVRCLTALAGSTVSGFTLRNGGTFNTTGGERDENMGGLAIAPSCRHGAAGSAVFENCVLSNGWGRTAGCVAGGILRRCKVIDGHATSGATLSMYSRFENCLLVNDARNSTGVRNCGGMLSTTYINKWGASVNDNSELNGSLYSYGASYENSILATANLTGGHAATMKNMTNCLWVTGGGNATVDSATCAYVITVATVADALAMLDADYAPLAGSDLVDAGDRALLAHLAGDATTDLAGGQRIYGGALDIGAFEYDLRPALASALYRKASVVAASPEAGLSGSNIVLPSGEIALTLAVPSDTAYFVPVEVTGTGTLSVFVGDSETPVVTVVAADGAVRPRLSVPAGSTVRFVYEPGACDTGAAILGSFVSTSGMLIFIR